MSHSSRKRAKPCWGSCWGWGKYRIVCDQLQKRGLELAWVFLSYFVKNVFTVSLCVCVHSGRSEWKLRGTLRMNLAFHSYRGIQPLRTEALCFRPEHFYFSQYLHFSQLIFISSKQPERSSKKIQCQVQIPWFIGYHSFSGFLTQVFA